jgi:hypothetical protein
LQLTAVWLCIPELTIVAGSVTVMHLVATQPFASVTVTHCVPEVNCWAVAAVSPLVQRNAYPPVPPDIVAVPLPSLPPKQLMLLFLTAVSVNALGSVRLTVVVSLQPLPSVTVTVYVPGINPVTVVPVLPFDQLNVYGVVPSAADTVADPSPLPLQLIACPL